MKLSKEEKARLDELREIQKLNDGFGTKEEANEFVKLRIKDWPNLRPIGLEEQNGKFNPQFNVWE